MLRVALATCVILSVVGTLQADEVCVACMDPAATYRCTFAQSTQNHQLQLGDAAQVHICKSVLERSGPHASCAIIEGAKPCDGVPRTVTVADYQKLVASDGHSTYQQGVLEKAQEGVSSTWNCLSSFFGDC